VTRHRAGPLAAAFLACAIVSGLPADAFGGTDRLLPTAAGPTAATPTVATPAERGAGSHADTLLVRLRPGLPEASARSLFAAAGVTEVGRLDELGTRVVAVASGQARAPARDVLREGPGVLSVEVDGSGTIWVEPNDTLWYAQWSERKIRAPKAWNLTTGAGSAIIAILDTGVYSGHRDLSGRVIDGHDFVNQDGNAADDNGHGTLVAGVAAGRGNNVLGVAGTCWGCRILPVKVANRSGAVRWSNAAAGIIWATKHGADVINMSFGAKSGSSTLAAAVQYAQNNGVVVVASAGNTGNRTRFYPASYPGVLSVAATKSSDTLYSWSTRGSWVKLAAPGCTWTTKRGGGWGPFCGTSASAPIVAGIAGLALSLQPGATRTKVIRALRETAIRFSSKIGGGRVDAYATVLRFQGGD
jgi:subtilisin family serine protease